MCHQKVNSRTCTKIEEEEFGMKQTEILCQSLMMGFTKSLVKKKIEYENHAYHLYIPYTIMTKFLYSTYFSIQNVGQIL